MKDQSYRTLTLNLADVRTKWIPKSLLYQQRRCFKTRRDRVSEFENVQLRDSLFGRTPQPKKEASAKLNRLLADTEYQPELQEKIKVAFAEGYVANSGDGKKQQKNKILGLSIGSWLIIGVTVWIFYLVSDTMTSVSKELKYNVVNGDKYEIDAEQISVTFKDVKGADEAKQELQDVVEFLKDPEKFTSLGAKLPKGVLLQGQPGIGKTLLARAVAGEAEVPFFYASGSEFEEVFVGTGARRVRVLFGAAKQRAPCVVFIDEIDTVGAKRTNSQLHPYASQTINQLLAEMDGFNQNEGIIVLGATNKKENLDKALLRPGRFDIEIKMFPPDLKGRREILQLYLNKIKMGPDIDIDRLARGTTGCTGADLENIVNSAALKAAKDNFTEVYMEHLEFARDKVLMGPARKAIPDHQTNLMTAYHESGHALVAYYTKDSKPLNKLTILPRGSSLGHTSFLPKKDQYTQTKSQLMATMDVLMGGRLAEEIAFGSDQIGNGARSDFRNATSIATSMVKQFGMSDKVGVRVFYNNETSQATNELVDEEIKRLLQESYDRAKSILKHHTAELHTMAKALMKYETLDASDFEAILKGKDIEKKKL